MWGKRTVAPLPGISFAKEVKKLGAVHACGRPVVVLLGRTQRADCRDSWLVCRCLMSLAHLLIKGPCSVFHVGFISGRSSVPGLAFSMRICIYRIVLNKVGIFKNIDNRISF